MKRFIVVCMILLALAPALFAQKEKPAVSEKQDVAIFGLGYYGWDIPQEALGSIDIEIQKVFIDLGRFNVIGMTQRFASTNVGEFVNTIAKMKKDNVVIPEKYSFGEAILTEADFNKLVNAFVIAIPVVTNYNAFFDAATSSYKADINTAVSFIDANLGKLIGVADVKTSGSNKSNQNRAVQDAIGAIPMQLQFEIRKIDQFQNKTRILSVSFGEIKMELGSDMGVKLGDEYAVKVSQDIEGITEDNEVGLVVIKNATKNVSTATVLYSDVQLEKNLALQEIPRLGVEAEVFGKYLLGPALYAPLWQVTVPADGTIVAGLKSILARGFYDLRPFVIIEVPVNGILSLEVWGIPVGVAIPINVMLGGEFNLMLGRISLVPSIAIGASYIYIAWIDGSTTSTSDSIIPHVGGNGSVKASFLVTRDIKIFVEAGYELWYSLTSIYSSYGGPYAGAGVTLKL